MADDNDADKRSEHTVEIGGVEHTLLLTDEDAERMGAAGSKSSKPANKSRTTASDK